MFSRAGRGIYHGSGDFDLGRAHGHSVFEFDYLGAQHARDSLFPVLFHHFGCELVAR